MRTVREKKKKGLLEIIIYQQLLYEKLAVSLLCVLAVGIDAL